jgi:isochorismate synthase/2-succinyl-5-enolpyruvyl-6-hydroxy-3-cyclohexene-1-carboxylate synthase/2-succinyl-6-hydroxy-2,4-cyclohexadiene-1-carboxylate synthase/O-succinylbenzoate synthase
MCRAQGVPHQRVTAPDDLSRALRAAWGLNRHSVVEVVTSRADNLGLHKALQSEVAAAVRRAHALVTVAQGAGATAAVAGGSLLAPPLLAPRLLIAGATVSRYCAPLARPLTTKAGGGAGHREGCLLTLTLSVGPGGAGAGAGGAAEFRSVGEAAPLPGLSLESADDAAAQLHALAALLRGAAAPAALPLLGLGGVSEWLRRELGLAPEALHPSVRCALEGALLGALARAKGCSVADLLARGGRPAAGAGGAAAPADSVALNALLACASGPPAEAAAEAAALAAAGARAIKIKVGRRLSPAEDAEAVLAVRAAVGPAVALRADANRAWSLEQALVFGRRAAGAGLQYVEEPTADPLDMAAFFLETGSWWTPGPGGQHAGGPAPC